MKIAKGEDEIGRAGRCNFALPNAKNSRRKLAECRLVGLDLAAAEGVELVRFGVRGLASSFRLQRDIVAAMIAQEERKNFRPVAAARPDLDHGRLRRDSEERELIEWVTGRVPRDKFRASRRIADSSVKRQLGGGGGCTNSGRHTQDGRDRESR